MAYQACESWTAYIEYLGTRYIQISFLGYGKSVPYIEYIAAGMSKDMGLPFACIQIQWRSYDYTMNTCTS